MKPPSAASAASFCRTIAPRLTEVDDLCRSMRTWFGQAGLAENGFALELLARESLNNAVTHVSRRHADETISLELCVGRRWIRLQVTDEGPGFNWRRTRHRRCELDAVSGRGLELFAFYAERVQFNRRGNRITLWVRRDT